MLDINKSNESVLQVKLSTTQALVKNVLLAEYVERERTKWQTFKLYPYATYCVLTIVFALTLTTFESQAGGIVISISQFRRDFGEPLEGGGWVIPAKWQSSFLGVPLAAQLVGQNLSAVLTDKLGKKWLIFITIIILSGFVGFQFASTTVETFLASKTLIAICLGVLQVACAGYVADIAPFPLRGFATTLCNLSYSIGPMVCFIINFAESTNPTRWAYRSMFASQWGFAVVSLVLILFVPESPVFYVMRNEPEKAVACYMRLLRNEGDAHLQLQIVETTIREAEEAQHGSTYLDCFRGVNLRRTLVAAFPFFFQAFSGVTFTINYTAYWFQLAGYSDSQSFKLTIGAQTQSICGCIAALFVVDRFGRRNTILYGVAALAVVCFIIGGTGLSKGNPNATKTTVAFMMMYGFWYNLGLGCVCYPIALENPTIALRTKTLAIALTSNILSSILWSFVIPYIFNPDEANLGSSTMFIFGGCGVLFWIYFFFFIPETAHRSSDEIDEMYIAKIPAKRFKLYISKVERAGQDAHIDDRDNKAHATHVDVA